MRLTILNQFYAPDISPTAHLAASLAEHRAARGDAVTVVSSAGGYVAGVGGANAERAGNPDVRRVWTPQFGKANLVRRLTDYASYYAGALWAMLRLPRQDAIVSLTTPPYIVLAALAHKRRHPGAKVVLWNMDCYPDAAERAGALRRAGLLSRALRAANRFVLSRVDHLVCLDDAMAELLVSQYAPRGKPLAVSVVPNWEPRGMYPGPTVPQSESPPSWFPRDRFVVLYLGNAGSGHDFATVLAGAERLHGEAVTFLFVGGGSRYAAIRRRIAELRLDNVQLEGYVPKERTPALLAAAGCALITLRDAALGVMSPSKLHAQLAMGLPVLYVGPKGSNVDEAVARFGCGVSLRHGDDAGVAGFITRLARDEPHREELRRRARLAFEEAYSDARCLPRFDAILDACLPLG